MSSSTDTAAPEKASANRGAFSGRSAFIFAAIGSAVGLGNIWRFPAVAYENGGGAFMIPYLVALLTAGIPLLFVDYAIGHRWRGSAPLAWRRLKRWGEFIGWWQVLICVIIGAYYALIIAWAADYMFFSLNTSWGDDAAAFFGSFTQAPDAAETSVGGSIVWPVLISIVVVWVATVVTMILGIQNGIARLSMIFIPLLVIMFVILVVRALFLPGALVGLETLFTPNWSALADGGVWVAAYGQIFFSLSVAFGIMLTYSSYLKKKSDLTGSGLVVGFSNSAFEILAGIGVFSALGFMAQAQGVRVDEVVSSGIGLAFIAFPTIIGEAPGGALIGVLFFGSLVLAGFTSLVSIVEVVISAVHDKFGMSRAASVLVVMVPLALVSTILFSFSSGLPMLDVLDKFVNEYGIVAVALVSTVILAWLVRGLPTLRDHLNHSGSFKIGWFWIACVAVVDPIVLAVTLFFSSRDLLGAGEPYGGYPAWFVNVFGWGMAALLLVAAIVLSLAPWSPRSHLHQLDSDGDEVAPDVVPGQGLEHAGAATPHAMRTP
ncbi:sodium-dependent transporter [Brachybacterium huguangmaarense]|uniref:Sodium-dependent transporter n=1 Tax=Brachybacterium huguangmaarense TaxID=1652028 RepID=A0ABY6G3U3_9MICO|nr:sodium-dependent transporter [Brachybacterium huguangmaarense]UYG17308.1 sodium-dependent transporter [Brachybacterium huguangmaarense]